MFALLAAVAAGAAGATPLEISGLLQKAQDNFNQQNFDGASALLDQIDKAKGESSQSLDLRGSIYLEQGKFDEATKAFRAATNAEPSRFPPRLHLADVLMREKKYSEAREMYSDLAEQTDVQSYNEKLRYAVLLTYLFEHNEARAQTALEKITFPTESAAYYCAQAAWGFAHDHPGDGKKWLKAAARMFDAKSISWFTRPLYETGWIKEKPVASAQ